MAWPKSLRFAFPIFCYSHLVLSLDSPLGNALTSSNHWINPDERTCGLAENVDHAVHWKTTSLHPGSLDEAFRDDFQARYPYETTPYEGILFYEEAVIERYLSSLSHTSGERTGTTASDQAHDSSVVSASASSNMEKHASEVKGVGKIRRTRAGGDNTLSNGKRVRHEKKPRFPNQDQERAEEILRHVNGDEGDAELARFRLTSSTPAHRNSVEEVPSEHTKGLEGIIEEITDTIMQSPNLLSVTNGGRMERKTIGASIQVIWDKPRPGGRNLKRAFSRLYSITLNRHSKRGEVVKKVKHLFDALRYCHGEAASVGLNEVILVSESISEIQLLQWYKLILVGKNQDTIPLIGEFKVEYILKNPEGCFSPAQLFLVNLLVNKQMHNRHSSYRSAATSLLELWSQELVSQLVDGDLGKIKKQELEKFFSRFKQR
ncbi:hypothetical protein MJO28_006864 [Puccinia striiformis f. sp. tritici]|uniref:Uncharacterized protein n=2 Tax=Puccinia striiformis f. sp. tritici TaxID=168172 RepID=A0A0L0UZL2_9BASI|nr:hypothetical protein MJO28_006864 [Puccinia striiformis f. sp. tritici]KAI7955435.1 hypothetical protein MJO29_006834 [Puccinia striiformis f. sp. tritici]KNE92386.1 hypothetical protein PSTG_14221 [Puccinia striiformis f. sp. tritici PST-78]